MKFACIAYIIISSFNYLNAKGVRRITRNKINRSGIIIRQAAVIPYTDWI